MKANSMTSNMASITMGSKTRMLLTALVLLCTTGFLLYSQVFHGIMMHIAVDVSAVSDLPVGFQPNLSKREEGQLYAILAAFDKAMRAANLTYMMCCGTLLGAYRHHGMIPWDDDGDVFVLEDQKDQVEKVLHSLAPEFTVVPTPNRPRWKLFPSSNPHISGLDWSFPFVDVGLVRISKHSLADLDWHNYKFRYDTSMIFPLVERPFGKLKLFSPRDIEGVLKKTYDLDLCQSNEHSHRKEKHIFIYKKLMCKELHRVYPFVHRVKNSKGINETLKIGNVSLRWYLDQKK